MKTKFKSVNIEGMTMFVENKTYKNFAKIVFQLGFMLLLVMSIELMMVQKATAVTNYQINHGFQPVK